MKLMESIEWKSAAAEPARNRAKRRQYRRCDGARADPAASGFAAEW